MYDAVRTLNVPALQAASTAELLVFLPVLVWQAEWQPAVRSVLDRVPARSNYVLRLHETLCQPASTFTATDNNINSFEFSKLPLQKRIAVIFDSIRRQTAHPILSNSLFQTEISNVVAVALLRSVVILPLPGLLRALLLQNNGVDLCFHILINCHSLMTEILETVITLSINDSHLSRSVEHLLTRIATLSRSTALPVRRLLLQHQVAAPLIVQITLEMIHDEVEFISAILAQRDLGSLRFLQALRANVPSVSTSRGHHSGQRNSAGNSPLTRLVFDRFRDRLQTLSVSVASSEVSIAVGAAQVVMMIRAICQLQALIQAVIPRDLTSALLDIATGKELLLSNSILSDCALCFLFQCSSLFKAVSTEKVVRFLRSIATSGLFKRIALGCFHGERSVGPLLSDVIGVPVRLLSGHVEKLSDLIASDLSLKFLDIAFHDGFEWAGITSYLLGSATFAKKFLDDNSLRNRLRDHLTQLLLNPVYNPAWIPVLQRTAELCVSAFRQSNRTFQTPKVFSERHINDLFSSAIKSRFNRETEPSIVDEYSSPTTVILVIYYVLYYNRIANKKIIDGLCICHQYPSSILDRIPVFSVIKFLDRVQSPFAAFYPQIQDLLLEQHAELLESDISLRSDIPGRIGLIRRQPDSLELSFECLQALLSLPDDVSIRHSTTVLGWIPDLIELSEAFYPYLFSCFSELWFRWSNYLGCISFCWKTLSYLSPNYVAPGCISSNLITTLPTKDKFWSSPSLTEIFLSILRIICVRSDRNQASLAEKEKLSSSYGVICQLLDTSIASPHAQTQSMIFRFIDGEFIRSPSLLQYCLQKGVPLNYLTRLVTHITSLEGAITYLPELLSREYEEEQVFSLCLLAELSHVYQSKTKELCSSVLKRFSAETGDSIVPHIGVLKRSLHAFVRIAQCHPFLTRDVVHLLSILRPFPSFECTEQRLADDCDRAFLAILDRIAIWQQKVP